MCLNPISITREIAGRKYTQVVPCGKCIQCKTKDQGEYVQRCMNAANEDGQVWFVTLTYNNDNVPVNYRLEDPSKLFDCDGEIIEDSSKSSVLVVDKDTGEVCAKTRYLSLDREDIKKWKKRVKMTYERKKRKRLELNYIICGEYGPRTHRPHYHGMFF